MLKVLVNDKVVGLTERGKTQRMFNLRCLKSDLLYGLFAKHFLF
jgi:hypothetical protein